MYLGYQNEKIVFYTEKELDPLTYNIDKSEYTDKEYVLRDDCSEYVLKDEAWQKEHTEFREKEFKAEFFETSLGWIKRIVKMKDETTRDFLSDILPRLRVGVPIITYNIPDFGTEELPTQNTGVTVTQEFINECDNQLLNDFYGESKESD